MVEGVAGADVAARARSGGYYLDDGPGTLSAVELDRLAALPDPIPVTEPILARANRPYHVLGSDYRPMTRRVALRQRGVASWYGKRFHGRPTSIGEPYDMYRMTAAHPIMPLPSFARVTNLENGRSVVVRINDRGPFLHDRAIDLSYLAAYKLDFLREGKAPVEIELIDPQSPSVASSTIVGAAFVAPISRPSRPAGGHFLQLGAFRSRSNAEAALAGLRRQGTDLAAEPAVVQADGLYRVRAGPFADRTEAARAGADIAARTGLQPILISPQRYGGHAEAPC